MFIFDMKYDILLLKMSNNGKGISVGIAETEDHYEYQVQRLYK